jgi:hypothetical protein
MRSLRKVFPNIFKVTFDKVFVYDRAARIVKGLVGKRVSILCW